MASDDRKPIKFTGAGFDKSEFPPEERAQMRERFRHFDQHFLSSDDFLKATGMVWVSKIAQAGPTFFKGFVLVGSLAAAAAAIQKMGWM